LVKKSCGAEGIMRMNASSILNVNRERPLSPGQSGNGSARSWPTEQVLSYLSRYTHRVAISNSRLLALDDRGVTFRWKDYREHGRTRYKTMTLKTDEFMRRFLLHVLPSGFHRIRHYGLLANANRQHDIATARGLLHQPAHASRCARRWQHRSQLPQTHLCVPTLRRPDARHRDLRARSVHPWPARFIGRTMIDIGSITKTSLAASATSMPSRTPMATFCKPFRCCHHHRLLNARCRYVLGAPPTHIGHAVPTIFASLTNADVQIPIDPRLC
jgi:hypothetical protein